MARRMLFYFTASSTRGFRARHHSLIAHSDTVLDTAEKKKCKDRWTVRALPLRKHSIDVTVARPCAAN